MYLNIKLELPQIDFDPVLVEEHHIPSPVSAPALPPYLYNPGLKLLRASLSRMCPRTSSFLATDQSLVQLRVRSINT